MTPELGIGATIGGYRIEGPVGRGGMGVVYRATDLGLGRTVALKVLAPELAGDAAFRERFARESKLAARIDHPNVIPIYQADEADGHLYIVMRWVEGDDLGQELARAGTLPLDRTVVLLEQVAAALDAAHERGLIHRDVKPANVLVVPGGSPGQPEHVYLTDFGIAKMTAAPGLTRTGSFLGTPDYAAPEQFEGRELDRRVDVYALGCLLYHCLAGRRPFERTDDLAVMFAHVQEPPPRLSEVRADLPAALDDVVATGMAKARDDRYPTCGALAAALRSAVRPTAANGDRDAVAPAPRTITRGPVRAPVTAPAPAAPDTRPAERASSGRRRRLAIAGGAAAVVLAAGAAVAALTFGGGGEPSLPEEAEAGSPPGAAAPPVAAAPPAQPPAPPATEPGTWTRLEAPELGGPDRQAVYRFAATADGAVVAVGTHGLPGRRDAVVWRIGSPAATPQVAVTRIRKPGDQLPLGVTPTAGDTVIGVGFTRADAAADSGNGLVLTFDGFALETAEVSSPGFEKMNRAVATGAALVAVGAAGPGAGDGGVPEPTDAAVWRSRDGGVTWERVAVETFRRPGYQEMRSVVPFAAGTAAVGHDREHGAVWLSNGIEWRRVAADSPALAAGADRPDVDLRDVQTLAGGLVAVGDVLTADGDRDAAVWTSRDGETWSIVRSPAFQGPADEQMIAVATGGFGAVAVGCASCETPGARPVVWRSPDGRTWRRVPASELPQADGLEQLATVTVAGDVLVAGGRHGDDAVVWTTPIAG